MTEFGSNERARRAVNSHQLGASIPTGTAFGAAEDQGGETVRSDSVFMPGGRIRRRFQ